MIQPAAGASRAPERRAVRARRRGRRDGFRVRFGLRRQTTSLGVPLRRAVTIRRSGSGCARSCITTTTHDLGDAAPRHPRTASRTLEARAPQTFSPNHTSRPSGSPLTSRGSSARAIGGLRCHERRATTQIYAPYSPRSDCVAQVLRARRRHPRARSIRRSRRGASCASSLTVAVSATRFHRCRRCRRV